MTKANVGLMKAMDVENDHEAIAKVAVGHLQIILGSSKKHHRQGNKGSKDE